MKHRQVGMHKSGVLNADGHTIGLDIGATAVRATVLAPGMLDGRPSVTVHGGGKVDLEAGVVVNGVVREPALLTTALKQLWHENKIECRNVILGTANQQVLVRDITIPDLSPQQRAKALPYQAREIVALPIDQVVLDFCQLTEPDPETKMVRGLLLATPREPILGAVSAVERAGLKVRRVDLSSFGSMRAIADEQLTVEAIIDLGAHLTTILIHDHGVPKLVRTLARGGHEISELFADRLGVNALQAEETKCAEGLEGPNARVLVEALRPLFAEIRTSMQYYRSMNDGGAIERISLTGGGSALRGIADALEQQIGLPTRVVDPMQHVRNRLSSTLPRGASVSSAISIGLAMGAAA